MTEPERLKVLSRILAKRQEFISGSKQMPPFSAGTFYEPSAQNTDSPEMILGAINEFYAYRHAEIDSR